MATSEVVVVCSNVSNNCLGRALLLAALIQRFARARVVGANLADAPVWEPAAGFNIDVQSIRLASALSYRRAAGWFREQMRGNRIVVSKPLHTSLGLTLAAGVGRERLLLDVDDWEVGLFGGAGPWRQWWDLVRPARLNSLQSIKRLDRTIPRYPHLTVSNRWLQQRYGGQLLPHVRDTDVLRPDPSARAAARAQLDMQGRFWVGFVGTIRQHKGVDVLLEAITKLDSQTGLYLAGVDYADPYTAELVQRVKQELPPERLRVVETFDFSRLGYFLGAADVLCIPSRASDAAAGQIPAKLFDALAMGLPVVVSDVNEMAQIVGDAGLVVPPGDSVQLAAALGRYEADPGLRAASGQAARARALEQYSFRHASNELEKVVSGLTPFFPV